MPANDQVVNVSSFPDKSGTRLKVSDGVVEYNGIELRALRTYCPFVCSSIGCKMGTVGVCAPEKLNGKILYN